MLKTGWAAPPGPTNKGLLPTPLHLYCAWLSLVLWVCFSSGEQLSCPGQWILKVDPQLYQGSCIDSLQLVFYEIDVIIDGQNLVINAWGLYYESQYYIRSTLCLWYQYLIKYCPLHGMGEISHEGPPSIWRQKLQSKPSLTISNGIKGFVNRLRAHFGKCD